MRIEDRPTPKTDELVAFIKSQLSEQACDTDHPYYVLDVIARGSRRMEQQRDHALEALDKERGENFILLGKLALAPQTIRAATEAETVERCCDAVRATHKYRTADEQQELDRAIGAIRAMLTTGEKK